MNLVSHVILWVGAPHCKSPPCQVWWSQASWQWRYILVAEEENSRCSRFSQPLLFTDIVESTRHIINSDPGYTCSKQQLDKNWKITFASPSKSTDEIEKEKKRKAIAQHFVLHAKAKMKKKISQVGLIYLKKNIAIIYRNQ